MPDNLDNENLGHHGPKARDRGDGAALVGPRATARRLDTLRHKLNSITRDAIADSLAEIADELEKYFGPVAEGDLSVGLKRENELAQLPALIMANIEDVPGWADSTPLATAHCHAYVLHHDLPAQPPQEATMPDAGLVEALEKIVEVGTRTETVRIGDAWSPGGWQDNEIVSEEAQIAAEALAALTQSPLPREGEWVTARFTEQVLTILHQLVKPECQDEDNAVADAVDEILTAANWPREGRQAVASISEEGGAALPNWNLLSDTQRVDIEAHVRALTEERPSYLMDKPPRLWRCFHCGEVFRTEEGARLHFGDKPTSEAACLAAAAPPHDGRIEGPCPKCGADQCWMTECPKAPHDGRGEVEAKLDFHDSDCATHNKPAEPNGPCNCWIAKAVELAGQQWPDTEDYERFYSWYGPRFINMIGRIEALRQRRVTP